MTQLDREHAFKYHYSFEITDEQLRTFNSQSTTLNLNVTFYEGASRKKKIEGLKCIEKLSGFHRKLVFNLLSRVPPDVPSVKISAKYCYVVFEDGGFLFCIDAVRTNKEGIVIPAQYLYEAKDPKGNKSVIHEYLSNLDAVFKKISGDSKDQSSSNPFADKKNWPYYAGFIRDEFEIKKEDKNVQFHGTGKLMRHPLGEFAGMVPIPPFSGDAMTVPEHGIVAGTLAPGATGNCRLPTPSIRSGLEELTRILWGDGGLTTWIMGQAGTGKEVFAQALHHGSGRINELTEQSNKGLVGDAESMKLKQGLAVQSIAGVTLDEFNRRLFAVPEQATRCVVEVIDAMNGSIFLDEFDKPKERFAIYSSLLRVLEAKQYIKRTYTRGSGDVQETPSTFSKVNWIFAGAFTQIDPRKEVPFDLWGRLKGFIHLRNPLQDDTNYGAALFLYSYLRLVTGVVDSKRNLRHLIDALEKQHEDRDYSEHVASILLGQKDSLRSDGTFLPSNDLQKFAFDFQRLLNTKVTFSGDRIDSPRGIFKATEATFNFLREKVFHGESSPLLDEIVRDLALEEAQKSLRLSRGPA